MHISHNPTPSLQAPKGLSPRLASVLHLVETSVRSYLVGLGMQAASVPFVHDHTKMTLLKGEAALAARRHVASKLTDSAITALQRARRIDKPNWSLMQQLHDAGFQYDPISGQPVYDPSKCSPQLLAALWSAYCGVAETINTKDLGQTEEALEELKSQLLEHAAQVREIVPRTRRLGHGAPSGVSAKRPRSSLPASSLSDEGTDTGEPGNRQRKRQRMSDESRDEALTAAVSAAAKPAATEIAALTAAVSAAAKPAAAEPAALTAALTAAVSATSVLQLSGSDDTAVLDMPQALPSAPQPPLAPPPSPPPSPPTLSPQPSPCLLYTSPSPRDVEESRMPSSA